MHIPTCETGEIEILDFTPALQASLEPAAEYNINEWLFVPNQYDEYRYILGTRGNNPLICYGINPSTAAPDALDNTLKSVERIALFNGFDSFIMLNVYAQRATNPDDMEKHFNAHLHEENKKAFEYALSLCKGERPTVWAAWGNIVEKRKYLNLCLREIIQVGNRHNAYWVSAGKISVKGHPHHPLYLKKDSPLDAFDMESYQKRFAE
ncbi:MAG: DUF1643 domain-containing protein [Candidatus Fimenecus sp.]